MSCSSRPRTSDRWSSVYAAQRFSHVGLRGGARLAEGPPRELVVVDERRQRLARPPRRAHGDSGWRSSCRDALVLALDEALRVFRGARSAGRRAAREHDERGASWPSRDEVAWRMSHDDWPRLARRRCTRRRIRRRAGDLTSDLHSGRARSAALARGRTQALAQPGDVAVLRVTWKLAPPPAARPTASRAPIGAWSSMMRFTTARPMPAPCVRVVKNASKMLVAARLGDARALVVDRERDLAARAARRARAPSSPRALAWIALRTRFQSTWRICAPSQRASTSPSGPS